MKSTARKPASPPVQVRNLTSDQEVVRCSGDLGFILRERIYDIRDDGSKGSERFIRYTAWEPIAIGSRYGTCSTIGPDARPWGRVDTKFSVETSLAESDSGWLAQQSRLRRHELTEQERARKLIVDTCPETADGYFGPEGIKLAFLREGSVMQGVEAQRGTTGEDTP